ncbi:hypothetical protein M404DRAFT_1008599 [Pisolithus tinctorius Marx 270]|uniref:Uncharacterized protein n=1 Tax=Pisolithus tinctorius Marx 270 TaxID=870435 RepID=A0A0C3IAJ5_PISTI|nr:hypothetical protein M404DRAFT_1008599 [Pisolithus tinctorius Marx 270]
MDTHCARYIVLADDGADHRNSHPSISFTPQSTPIPPLMRRLNKCPIPLHSADKNLCTTLITD